MKNNTNAIPSAETILPEKKRDPKAENRTAVQTERCIPDTAKICEEPETRSPDENSEVKSERLPVMRASAMGAASFESEIFSLSETVFLIVRMR